MLQLPMVVPETVGVIGPSGVSKVSVHTAACDPLPQIANVTNVTVSIVLKYFMVLSPSIAITKMA
jgi:hypothetical protein